MCLNKEDELEDSLEFCRDIEIYYKKKDNNTKSQVEYQRVKSELNQSNTEILTSHMELESENERREYEKKEYRKKEVMLDIIELIVCVFVALGIGYLLTKYVVICTKVDGISMEDSLLNDDYLVIDKVSYTFWEPERFDIIVFPHGENTYYIKRIIGMPGERIQIRENQIYINDKLLEEDYGKGILKDGGIVENQELLLGNEEYFVLGDNRNHSVDSRFSEVGTIKRKEIIGKAWFRLYPFQTFGVLK